MRISHVAWNLGGLGFPLLVAVITVPSLMENLGQERFGLLALAWGLIGYAGALDLGIGRATTQSISRALGARHSEEIPGILATAARVTLLSGLAGGVLIIAVVLLGGAGWVRTAATPTGEIVTAMLMLAIALPAQAMSATYRGVNEAYMNFRGISLLRAGLGIINFGGPFLISGYSSALPGLVATLVVSRLVALFVYRQLAWGCLRRHGHEGAGVYAPSVARTLFGFGGWVTVSSVVSPVLVQADRFVIGATISAAAVSAYVLPYEVVVQSLILVGAVSSVIFPGLTRLMEEQPNDWKRYFWKWFLRVAALMLCVCATMALLLPVILPLWIGDNLPAQSIGVGQVLCIGVFANSLGAMFYALLHAKRRSDITAKIHLLELPLFIFTLIGLTNAYGVFGAAAAWCGRMILDTAMLAICSKVKSA